MNLHMSLRLKLFLSHLFAVLVVSGSIGTYFYTSAAESLMNGLKERLQASAALISQTIDADQIRAIRSPEDAGRPAYKANLEKLRILRRMNSDIAYLYVMRQEGERVYFVIDSDESEGQALPGKEYPNSLPSLMRGFTGLSVDDRISKDEWGTFLSGYAPIKNSAGQYLVGIDMRADKVSAKQRSLRLSGILSLVASILMAFLFSRYLASRFMRPIRTVISRCTSIAAGRYDEHIEMHTQDDFDRLINAFNDMSDALGRAEQKSVQAFEDIGRSRDELKIRVRQRTADLKEVNDRLTQAIAERISAQKALEEAAITDPLTRLYNRRAMLERLENEIARHRRSGLPFSIAMADLDHFKAVNDDFGHDVGDSILVETGIRMKSMLRSQDTVARWGGEEFMVLLPDTGLEGACVAAEKIRRRIAVAPYYAAAREIRITASFGVACFDGRGDFVRLVKAADEALYEAKKQGRNQIRMVLSADGVPGEK